MLNCILFSEEDYKEVLARLRSVEVVCRHMRRKGDSYFVEEIERHLEAIETLLKKEEL